MSFLISSIPLSVRSYVPTLLHACSWLITYAGTIEGLRYANGNNGALICCSNFCCAFIHIYISYCTGACPTPMLWHQCYGTKYAVRTQVVPSVRTQVVPSVRTELREYHRFELNSGSTIGSNWTQGVPSREYHRFELREYHRFELR